MSRRSWLTKAVSVLLLVTIFVGVLPPAISAAPPSFPPTPPDQADAAAKAQAMKVQKERFERAVRLMETHIQVSATGELHLDVDKGAQLGIDDATFNALKAGLEQTNAQLRDGRIKLSDVHFLTKGEAATEVPEASTYQATACAGWTGYVVYWWGYELYLNECLTQSVINLLWIGTGVTALCAVIATALGGVPVAVICGAAAALITIGAGTLGLIDSWGGFQGIIVAVDWLGNLQWVWHQ